MKVGDHIYYTDVLNPELSDSGKIDSLIYATDEPLPGDKPLAAIVHRDSNEDGRGEWLVLDLTKTEVSDHKPQ